MTRLSEIVNSTKFKLILLFSVALIVRLVGLGGHNIFVDEITWMSRCKDVYATVRSGFWNPLFQEWWLTPGIAESIGLPITFLCGLSITFLSPGYSHFSLNLVKDFVAARFSDVILGAAFIPLFYFLVKKFVSEKVAFITSLFLALDPIAIASSRWLHQDVPLMTFSTLSILLFLYGKNLPGKNKLLIIASSFLAAMAILTKPQGFFVPLTVIFSAIATYLIERKVRLKEIILWLFLSAFFTILCFPYLWKNPIGNMLHYLTLQMSIVDLGNLTYFNGQITDSPPWYYYFVIFPFREPESVVAGFLVGIAMGIKRLRETLTKNEFVRTALIYTGMFLLLVSLSDKKLGIRYLLGIWPYIYLTAAFGLSYIERLIKKPFKKIYWFIVFLFPIWGVLNFYPNYYLFYNHFISASKHQDIESVGYCDSVRLAVKYLGPKLYHGVAIMLPGCDAAINYYTGFTIRRVHKVSDKPDFIILENHNSQKIPETAIEIKNANYKKIHEIYFRGLKIADIYQKP